MRVSYEYYLPGSSCELVLRERSNRKWRAVEVVLLIDLHLPAWCRRTTTPRTAVWELLLLRQNRYELQADDNMGIFEWAKDRKNNCAFDFKAGLHTICTHVSAFGKDFWNPGALAVERANRAGRAGRIAFLAAYSNVDACENRLPLRLENRLIE